MSERKPRWSWLLPAVIALGLFLGNLAVNLFSADMAAVVQPYRGWVWLAFALSAVVAVLAGVRAARDARGGRESGLEAARRYGELHRRYLQRVFDRCAPLPLRAIDFKSASAETQSQDRLHLADVYIALDTKASVQADDGGKNMAMAEGRAKPLSALAAFVEHPRLVLLGDPGSGKSTFLNHLGLCLAGEVLEPKGDWLSRLPGWPEERGALIPVPVALRELASWLEANSGGARGAGLLERYLGSWLNDLGLADFHATLREHLAEGSAVLLLDGFDEVPGEGGALGEIKRMIADLPKAYSDTAVVVTCRVLSYQDESWSLPERDWPAFELAPLTESQIDQFVTAWHAQLAGMNVVQRADALSTRLSQAVRRPDLWRLAGNPLLLTVMALVHTNKGELPDARALLYEDIVDLLLWRWEAVKLEDPQGRETTLRRLLQEASQQDIDLKQVIWELAYEAHGRLGSSEERRGDAEATADIAEDDLLAALRELHPERSLDWAEALVEIMKLRAGLLLELRKRVYSFPHRTFQEYLAACHLASQTDFTEVARELAARGTYWREVILLAVGRLVHDGRREPPLVLIDELCPEAAPPPERDSSWRCAWLAGQCLLEVGSVRARRLSLGKTLLPRVRRRLTALVSEERLEPRERAEAGSVLSALGDERDLEEMVEVPGGEFVMGSTGDEEFSHNDETPQHRVQVEGFRIGKYPVTNDQYGRFVEARGASPPPHWRGRTPPAELRTNPVVGVSWHDAMSYCAWLSEERGVEIRLPTEAEWEKAARGGDARVWPWGDKFESKLCNSWESGIRRTSPVGMFASGASASGCLDMGGNVWEWTSSLWGADLEAPDFGYPYDRTDGREDAAALDSVRRVVRGGSFLHTRDGVRCASRYGGGSQDRSGGIGFRVVAPGL